jgi:GTP-binding protein
MGDHAPHGREGLSAQRTEAEEKARLEAGRLLFAAECLFLRGAAKPDDLPPETLPELAFAGRSNVGKSSLINALTGRTTLARTSNTPGRTQELNFFEFPGRLVMVDMPGYGFAQAPKDLVKRWQGLVKAYLKGRSVLKRTLVLVDARHGIKETDREIMKMLDTAAVSYQIVVTKADYLKEDALIQLLQDIRAEIAKRPASHPVILATSSRTGAGIAELRAELAEMAKPLSS